MSPAFGIDVSTFNSVSDWSAVRGNGIAFASVKLTQGNYYSSPVAGAQVTGARAGGVTPGGYHFGDPRNGAVANADFFASKAGPLGVLGDGALLPMLDVENSPADGIQWDAGMANAFIPAWIARLRQQTGVRKVAVYSSLSFWQTVLRPNDWADTDVVLWLALYNGQPGDTGGWTHPRLAIHQHTDQGLVPGVAGLVDRNVTVNGFSLANLTLGSKKGTDVTQFLYNNATGQHATQDGPFLSGISADTVTSTKATWPNAVSELGLSQAEWDDRVAKTNSLTGILPAINALTAAVNTLTDAVRAMQGTGTGGSGIPLDVLKAAIVDIQTRTVANTVVSAGSETTTFHVNPPATP